MLTFYSPGEAGVLLKDFDACPDLTRRAVWIDFCEPTDQEEKALEAALGLDVPTRAEMQEIEISSRLYKENDVLYMTATVIANVHKKGHPESSPITFILTNERLITVRYVDPFAFQTFRNRWQTSRVNFKSGYDVMAGITDAIVERVADFLENVGTNLDHISLEVFDPIAASAESRAAGEPITPGRRTKPTQRDFVAIMRRIGANSDLVSRTRESLVSIGRLVAFFRETHKETEAAREALVHLKTLNGDLSSLGEHATFLSGKVGFVLDATLGMINNEQNAIIKILSVAALVFLPPTLVAGVYGMNFSFMPELKWAQGYPFALCLMVISAVLPYWIFKRKGWL